MNTTPRKSKKKERVPLHFIGKRVYSIKMFINEAKKIGVSRAIPRNILKKMNFGDRILLAVWRSTSRSKKRSNKLSTGEARVFGYFIIRGIHAEKEFVDRASKYLRVVATYSPGGGGVSVTRGCGSYIVGGGVVVDNTLKEAIEAIEKAEEELGKKTKIFAKGTFVEFDKTFVIKGVPFTRGIVFVDKDKIPEEYHNLIKTTVSEFPDEFEVTFEMEMKKKPPKGKGRILKVSNYKQAKYRSKKERRKFLNKSLEMFLR